MVFLLSQKTGARIKIFSNLAPQSTDRVIQIIGEPQQCIDTIREVLTLIKQVSSTFPQIRFLVSLTSTYSRAPSKAPSTLTTHTTLMTSTPTNTAVGVTNKAAADPAVAVVVMDPEGVVHVVAVDLRPEEAVVCGIPGGSTTAASVADRGSAVATQGEQFKMI